MMFRLLILWVAVLLAGCNPLSQPGGATMLNDVDLIQGTWKLDSMTSNDGSPIGFAGILGAKINGNRMDEWLDEDAIEASGDTKVISEFELFPGLTPKRIVLVSNWYDDGGPYPSHTQKGFYELTAETLTIKWGPDDYPLDDPNSYSQTCVYSRLR